jgi:hypothetical protein
MFMNKRKHFHLRDTEIFHSSTDENFSHLEYWSYVDWCIITNVSEDLLFSLFLVDNYLPIDTELYPRRRDFIYLCTSPFSRQEKGFL